MSSKSNLFWVTSEGFDVFLNPLKSHSTIFQVFVVFAEAKNAEAVVESNNDDVFLAGEIFSGIERRVGQPGLPVSYKDLVGRGFGIAKKYIPP